MKKIYLIAAVIALVAGFATYFFASELKTSKIVTGVDEATVLIAVQDIEKNTILTEDMFQETKLPVNAVSYGTVCNAKDVIGYMATDKILMGEQLMVRKITLVGDSKAEGRLSYQFEKGMYAYTISVEIENGVGYFIKEDDRINIYDRLIPSAEPIVENVPVIKISDYPSNILQDAGTEITTYATVTVKLNKQQIAKMLGVGHENFRVVLVSHEESHGLTDDIANASIPESRNSVPKTNYGMGEITMAPPTTEK